MRLVALVLAMTLMASSAQGAYVRDDPGGQVLKYVKWVDGLRKSGEKVVVDGECFSACTMILSLPRGQVCATPRAAFGFHDAWRPGARGAPVDSPLATRFLESYYPAWVRKWIAKRGGLKFELEITPRTTLTAPEVWQGVSRC